jgi:hypothetical protein
MTEIIEVIEHSSQKITAAEVRENCPATLKDLADQIAAHLKTACKYDEKAQQHYTSIGQHLAEAKKLCDEGGFNAFREKYCPDLERTRVYELLAIGNGKKSLEDTRADTRKRAAKHRAKKLGLSAEREPGGEAVGDVRYVTDSRGQTAGAGHTLTIPGNGDASDTVKEQTVEAVTPALADTPKDEGLFLFTRVVMQLEHCLGNHKPERFLKTAVPRNDLAKAGKFLSELAKLKKSDTKPTSVVDAGSNATVSAVESADEMKVKHEAAEELAA